MCDANTKIKGAIRLKDNDNGSLMGQRSCTGKLHTPKRVGSGGEIFPKDHRHRFTFERLKILGQSGLAGCETSMIATFPTNALSDYAERVIGSAYLRSVAGWKTQRLEWLCVLWWMPNENRSWRSSRASMSW